MKIDYKNELNNEQFAAVTSKAKHLRIVAGAGTGKTRVLTYRVCFLLEEMKYQPRNILCITFTNKVAKEMRERIEKLHGCFDNHNKPMISTYHSFCLQILRMFIDLLPNYKPNFTVIDEEDQFKALSTACENSNIVEVRELNKNDLKGFRAIFSKLKNSSISYENLKESDIVVGVDQLFCFENVEELYRLYCQHLKRVNAMDFDDLLLNCKYLLENCPEVRAFCQKYYKCILIDEFQDTNKIQFDILRLIVGENTMLTVVGDPDQTIYTWRGADSYIITNTIDDVYSDLVTLPLVKNYRSSSEIIQAANNVISNNKNRIPKELVSNLGPIEDSVKCYDLCDNENEGIFVGKEIKRLVEKEKASYNDIAIIYRANYLSRVLEKRLMEQQIPYSIYGGLKFLERAEVKDALAYLRLLINPDDDISFERVMKAPSRGAGDVVFNAVRAIIGDSDTSLFACFREGNFKMTKNTTKLVHEFFEAYDDCLSVFNDEKSNVKEKIAAINRYFEKTGFIDYVKSTDEKEKNSDSINCRLNNVKETVNSIEEFLSNNNDVVVGEEISRPSLSLYLQNAAIQSSQDEMSKKEAQKVSLMTVHVAKGLEFKYVFVCGLAENIFPSIHNNNTEDDLEEERRLMFVAMTRAQHKLYLTSYRGFSKVNQGRNSPSRFIEESKVHSETISEDLDKTKYEGDASNNSNIKIYKDLHWKEKSLNKNKEKQITSREFGNINVSSNSDTYVVGDKVQHDKFGVGVVVEVVDKAKIRVQFSDEFGIKTLAVGYKAFRKI